MESRRKLVLDVTVGGASLSAASRDAGVSRMTARKWVERSKKQGVDGLCELSRAPKAVHGKTDPATEFALLEMKDKYPEWGARKLVVRLQEERQILLATRTAEHILKRHKRTKPRPAKTECQRFEKLASGSMVQMDFKGLPNSCPYALLTVLDDYGRYCLAFEPVPDKTGPSVKAALWELFSIHGLPDSMLMDNGDCWGRRGERSVCSFEAWLMLLGIEPKHGRPGHPQTQGKVERFHGTAKLELAERLVQPSIAQARPILKAFVDRYNWVRPHDSLGGQVPGTRYSPFPRPRPNQLPEHYLPEGATSRCVDVSGYFSYKGTAYRIGLGLRQQRIELKEDLLGMRAFFAGFPLSYLHEL